MPGKHGICSTISQMLNHRIYFRICLQRKRVLEPVYSIRSKLHFFQAHHCDKRQ